MNKSETVKMKNDNLYSQKKNGGIVLLFLKIRTPKVEYAKHFPCILPQKKTFFYYRYYRDNECNEVADKRRRPLCF